MPTPVRPLRTSQHDMYAACVDALRAESDALLREQHACKYELGGLLVLDPGGVVRVRRCPVTNQRGNKSATALSSEPHCNGRRRCNGLRPGDTVIGEFHTHPRLRSAPVAMPSDSDMFQLGLAAHDGVHNCSAVVAPEGVYVMDVCQSAARALHRDLQRFYRWHGEPSGQNISRCREPIAELLPNDGSVPYLSALFTGPTRWFRALSRAASQGNKGIDDHAEHYIRRVKRLLGVHIAFFPHGGG